MTSGKIGGLLEPSFKNLSYLTTRSDAETATWLICLADMILILNNRTQPHLFRLAVALSYPE